MSAQEIKAKFAGFDTSKLPETGPWDMGRGFEDTTSAVERARRVAMWLRMPELRTEVGANGVLILVSHADFLALLMAALCNVQVMQAALNPDSEMSAHGVSECTLQQEISHDAASVYQKFRISLAATTMLLLGEEGEFAVEWMNKRSHLEDKSCCVA